MNLEWKHVGPKSAPTTEAPPVPSLIDRYVLAWDERAERALYFTPRDDDQRGNEVYAFDGTSWKKLHERRYPRFTERICGGDWDSKRGALVVWGFKFEREIRSYVPVAIAIEGEEAKPLVFTGPPPKLEADGESDIGTFDRHGAFTYDRARGVWVLMTRCGVWELDDGGAWTQKSDGAGVIPAKWSNATGTGTWDPVNRRCVFSVQESEDYAILAIAWDGEALTQLSMEGLPELHYGLFNPAAHVTGHAKHGLVLVVGAELYAPTATGWKALPVSGGSPPPRMEDAAILHDPKRDLVIVGPGKHEGAGGSDYQQVLFVARGGRWEIQGAVVKHSPLKGASYGSCRQAHVGEHWYATGTHSLRTWEHKGGSWVEIVDKKLGEKLGGWDLLWLLGGERLLAVVRTGAVFAFDGAKWTTLAKADKGFKSRTDFALSQDGTGRIVVWGGEVNGRKLNDTLFLEGGKWRAAKKPSPQPLDFKHGSKDGVYVDTPMIWDGTLGRLVRFGFEEIAVLGDDEIWVPQKPKGYKALVGSRRWGHAPFFDPKTGETLFVDFESGRIARFDLGGCVEVAKMTFPAELQPKKQHDTQAYHFLSESYAYDPKTRALVGQHLEDDGGVYRIELGPAFDHAKTLGPRTLFGATKSAAAKAPAAAGLEAARLYRVKGATASFVAVTPDPKNPKKAKVTTGTLIGKPGKPSASSVTVEDATKLLAAKKKEGFVVATALPRDALVTLAGVPSSKLTVGKVVTSGAPPKSRLGGAPSVVGKAWPTKRKKPLGFLFQLESGDLLSKYAAVAVFSSLDGEATTEEDENVVVLVKRAELGKKVATPAGVPALPVRPLALAEPKIEIDETRAHELGEQDPEMLVALEALQTKKGLQETDLAMKRGGVPQFLQGDATMKGWIFVAQLDFDTLDVSKWWPEAGLSGCVYVWVKQDESDAFAMWQYT